ncbi:MAG: sensor histidine kinase [Limnochordia bacterium]|jgi:two-component system CitB family sensor kinase
MNKEQRQRFWIGMAFFILITVISTTIYRWLWQDTESPLVIDTQIAALITMLSCLIIMVLLTALVVVSRRSKLQLVTALEASKLQVEQELGELLQGELYEFDNHLAAISILIQSGQHNRAVDYINDLKKRPLTNKASLESFWANFSRLIIMAEETGVRAQIVIAESFYRFLRFQGFKQVVTNLVTNAIEAAKESQERGKIKVEFTSDGRTLVFRVTNNGPPIGQDQMERIWEHNYSTKSPQTRGYGLWIVRNAVQGFGGNIFCSTDPQGNTFFEVQIPGRD